MHKRETFKIVLITLGVLAVIVINAIIFTKDEPDILDVPQTVKVLTREGLGEEVGDILVRRNKRHHHLL